VNRLDYCVHHMGMPIVIDSEICKLSPGSGTRIVFLECLVLLLSVGSQSAKVIEPKTFFHFGNARKCSECSLNRLQKLRWGLCALVVTKKHARCDAQMCFAPGFSDPDKYQWDSRLFDGGIV
jgi:hypothetical protein